MNILVTGGAGYIGSHTAALLRRSGHSPVIFDNLSTGRRSAVGGHKLVEADLADKPAIRSALAEEKVSAVVHFAASAYVDESLSDPRKYFFNNSVNSLNLLDAMAETGVKHLVYSSTCATYGLPQKVPINEEQPQLPINPYGESKLFVERALHWYEQAYDLRWVALRYFNAAGVSKELAGCCDQGKRLIPLAIKAVLSGEPLTVFGTDYPTDDGTAVRDYVHVEDLASAHLLALEYLRGGRRSRAFNLGVGRGHSIREVLAAIALVSGIEVPHRLAARRPGDPPVLVADAQAAREALGWMPQHSSLEEIVRSVWLAASAAP
jgi:UDP-arabinose 4-epimerase